MMMAQPARDPVECVIRVDGREISELYAYLSEVMVECSRKSAAACTLSFESARDSTGHWTVQDAGVFQPWRRIQILAAFGSRQEEVMRGFIREVKADYPSDMSAVRVQVIGQDESLLLDREHQRKTWSTAASPLTDGELVQRVAQENGLSAQVSTGLRNTTLASDGTAIKLLQERAEANGYELYVREGVVHFEPPQLSGTPMPTILVYAGDTTNCLNFAVRHDGHKPDQVGITRAADQGSDSESETFSPALSMLGKAATNSEDKGLHPFVWLLNQPSGATPDEVRARAQGKADENSWKVVAEGELDGALYGHVLLPFRTVSVDGVGDTYGGTYYVDEVKHQFSAEGYRQTFRLLRNATGDTGQSTRPDPLAMLRA